MAGQRDDKLPRRKRAVSWSELERELSRQEIEEMRELEISLSALKASSAAPKMWR